MKKFFLTAFFLPVLLGAKAQTVEGMIVATSSGEQRFTITSIQEVTFSDEGMTVIKTDQTRVSFADTDGWQIHFGPVDASGIETIEMPDHAGMAQLYDVNGVLLKEASLSAIDLDSLPKGVYILKCNGKSLKIKR